MNVFRLRPFAGPLLAFTVASAAAQPAVHTDACFVRAEPRSASAPAEVVPAATESRLGIRRRSGQLFDVELSVAGPGGAVCSVSGVARWRAGEVLALPVRAERGTAARTANAPCLVYLRATPDGVEITTTQAACEAQALCGGQVRLEGQRFDTHSRATSATAGSCFPRQPP